MAPHPPLPPRQDRAVVVVGDGHMPGVSLGAVIDSFKTVVRVGKTPRDDQEHDLGAKTHILFMDQEHWRAVSPRRFPGVRGGGRKR